MTLEHHITELRDQGFCILKAHFSKPAVEACREAFWPILIEYINRNRSTPNRGPHRHFLPMPFDPPCFAPEFFFNDRVIAIVRREMDDRIVADQWGCDVPLNGSIHQQVHVDYQRPLFPEALDLALPTYMLVVSFGLIDITPEHGPIELAAGTHRITRSAALQAAKRGEITLQPITMGIGDVLIRHPWVLHRGTPNTTGLPRALVTIRYVRRWYADDSRDVNSIPRHVWRSLSSEQRNILRFPIVGADRRTCSLEPVIPIDS